MSFRKSMLWTAFWVSVALIFSAGVYFGIFEKIGFEGISGPAKALEFLTGYVIELSLSMDNLFLFLILFTCFCVKGEAQRKILNYGVLGAVLMRLFFILVGVKMVDRFHWILYIFGAILIFTSFKIIFGKEAEIDPEKSRVIKLLKKVIPVTHKIDGDRFFIRLHGVLHATPFFVVLLLIESTDLIFAIDSIPAVFSITTDPFIVYTSNILAIMGLRSFYFFLEKVQKAFVFVKQGVGIILFITGLKMLLVYFHIKVPVPAALGMIIGVLALSIIASLLFGKEKPIECPGECPIPPENIKG